MVQLNGLDTLSGTSDNAMKAAAQSDIVNGHGKSNPANEAFVDNDVAISPNAPEEVPALLKRIALSGETWTNQQGEQVRTELLDAARSLVSALETPREAIIRFCWSQVTNPTCLL